MCKHLNLEKGLAEYRPVVESRDGIVERFEFEEEYLDVADLLSDDYVVSFECPVCGSIVWGEDWVREDGNVLIAIGCCEDGQEFLIKLKYHYLLNGNLRVRRFVYELTEKRKLDYEECFQRQAAWNKYVISA